MVDLSRTPLEDSPILVDRGLAIQAVTAPGLPSASLALEALSPRRLVPRTGRESFMSVKAAIEANRKRAYQEALRQLRQAYEADTVRTKTERESALDKRRLAEIESFYANLRGVFERYDTQLGDSRLKLANLVGYPDPDPEGKRPVVARDTWAQKRIDETNRLRLEIARLESDYRREVQKLLGEIGSRYDLELTQLRAAIEQLRADADERAKRNAERLTREAFAGVEQLGKGAEQRLPAVPAEGVALPAEPPTAFAAPALVAPPITDDRRTEVAIWARINGYRLAGKGESARDATTEFLQWRQKYKAAP